jgi:hypothetical protein
MSNELFSPVETKPSLPVGQIVTGAVLIVVGVGWLLSALDVAAIPWRALLAGVLIVVGIALATAAAQGAAPGGLFSTGITLVVILAMLSTVTAAFSIPLRGGIGDRDYNPTTATLKTEYNLIAGQLDLVLDDVSFPEGETRIEAGVTFGKLVIEDIPEGVAVRVEASATAGQINLFGSIQDGVNIDDVAVDNGFDEASRRLIIDARVGFGQIEVRR